MRCEFAVQTQTRNQQPLTCTLCGRHGHLAENCFKKIGYPAWWGERTRNKSGSTTQHHSAAGSQSKGKTQEPARANHVSASHVGSSSVGPYASLNSVITPADRVGFSGLNDQQWKTLVNMLNERNSTSHDHRSGNFFLESWIIDTGASNHMTGSLDYLTDVCDMAPMLIKLPDGRFTTSYRQGTVAP